MDKKTFLRTLVLFVLVACLLLTMFSREWTINGLSFYTINTNFTASFQMEFYRNVSSPYPKIRYFTQHTNTTQTSTLSSSMSKSSVSKRVFLSTTLSSTQSSTQPKQHSICAVFAGGLGNHMFHFASIFGISKLRNMSVTVGPKALLRQIFQFDKSIKTDTGPCRSAQGISERWASAFDNNLLNIDSKQNYRLNTYLQSWKYFKHAEEELRQQFRFKANIATDASKIIDTVLQKFRKSRSNVTLVGIHVRRGDMVNHGHGYLVATKEYLEKATSYYISKFKNIIFIVISNDMKWCKENIHKNNNILNFIDKNSAEVDLAILASCDHVIQTVGSFSWWAAWLAGGTSIFYKWPAKNGSALRRAYSKEYLDYFYPGWIGM